MGERGTGSQNNKTTQISAILKESGLSYIDLFRCWKEFHRVYNTGFTALSSLGATDAPEYSLALRVFTIIGLSVIDDIYKDIVLEEINEKNRA